MTTRGPFVVRLIAPDDQIVIDALDPSWGRSHRGGFTHGRVRLTQPIDSRSTLLRPFSKLRIEDARTAQVAYEGYLDLPGRERGDEGDVWEIGAVGPSARLSDRRRQYIGIDTSFEAWEPGFKSKAAMEQNVGTDPNDEDIDALVINWPDGIAVGAGDPTNGPRTQMNYKRLRRAGQFVGGLSFRHRDGSTNPNLRSQIAVSAAGVGGSLEVARNRAFDTALDYIAASAGAGAQFDTGESGKNIAFFRMLRDSGGATNIANDTSWTAARDIRVSALRRDQNADWIYGNGAYDNEYLLAHEVVIDALFFFCANFTGPTTYLSPIDIAGATIDDTFAHQIDQLVYTEPTTLQQVLEDLALLEPDMVWEVLESNSAGQHRFALRRLLDGSTRAGSAQSGARYLATTEDGWDSPGGESDLRNAVTVTWEDRTGKQESKSYTSDVDVLDQWAIVRDADVVDLGSDLGSEANADRIGPKILEEASKMPAAGNLTVRRKIHDLWLGRDVQPWEIEPGYPLLIQDLPELGTQPITETDYSDSSGTNVLTLSTPVRDDTELINQYAVKPRRRRLA